MGTAIERLRASGVLPSKSPTKVKPPAQYNVVLINDDYTPMEFVVAVLQKFFHMEIEQAVATMLKVHHEGKAICGVYHREIAETKVMLVNEYARQHEYPLLCILDKV